MMGESRPAPEGKAPLVALRIVVLLAIAQSSSAQGRVNGDADCLAFDHSDACPNHGDEIEWMQVSLLQMAQHVRPITAPVSAKREKQGQPRNRQYAANAMTVLTQREGAASGIADESWFAGIAMTIVGQTVCVIGMQMQKISHLIHTPEAATNTPAAGALLQAVASKALVDENSCYFFQWRWALGAFVWGLGHLMCWVALGLAPQSILSCLQSWNIVVALALAPVLLNETLPPHSFEFASLLVIGCVIVVWFGPRTEEYEFETVESLSTAFIAPSSAAVHFVCLGLLILSMTTSMFKDHLFRIERYVLMSATCAWYAALCSKALSMVVITSVVTHQDQGNKLGFWFFTLAFAVFALGQIHFMNLGLRCGLASAVMPMYEAISMIGQLFFGGILFGEFRHFQGMDKFGFIPGVLIILVGLALLIRSNRSVENAMQALPSECRTFTSESMTQTDATAR